MSVDAGRGLPSLEIKSAHQRRANLVQELLQGLEAFTFLQFAILFAYDDLLFLLLLRAVTHVRYLTLRPETPGPQLGPVVVANIVCLLSHLVISIPGSAGRRPDTYNYGGLVVDFVGELPVTPWKIILMDIMIGLIQMTMLALEFERANSMGKEQDTQQYLEAEESGVHSAPDGRTDPIENEEPLVGEHELDVFYTGQYVVMDLDVMQSLQNLAKSTPDPSSTVTTDSGGIIDSLLARLGQQP